MAPGSCIYWRPILTINDTSKNPYSLSGKAIDQSVHFPNICLSVRFVILFILFTKTSQTPVQNLSEQWLCANTIKTTHKNNRTKQENNNEAVYLIRTCINALFYKFIISTYHT